MVKPKVKQEQIAYIFEMCFPLVLQTEKSYSVVYTVDAELNLYLTTNIILLKYYF